MWRLGVFLTFVFLALNAEAQKVPFFSVETSDQKALRLSDIESEIQLDGPFGETTLDLTYANSSNQNLQGLFKIQLPPGAVVRDFALKLGEHWQMGTLTEKHKARTTFEEIVRRGLDPAVLAWGNGAEYQVRIFPFPAKGKRSIRLRYWQELPENSNAFVYNLPLAPGTKLDHFRLKLAAHAAILENLQVGESFTRLTYLKRGDQKNQFGAIVDEKDFTVPGEFRLSASGTKPAAVWTGKSAPVGDLTYIGGRVFADLPIVERKLPKTLLIFLDTSRSAKSEQPAQLNALFKSLAAKYASVTYYEFDATVRKTSQLNAEQASYDGGTDFLAVRQEIIKQKASGALDVLIVTDAIPTMHKDVEFKAAGLDGAKIFVLPTKSQFNPHFALLMTEASGGGVLPNPASASAQEILASFLQASWHYESVRFDGGTGTDVYPEAGSTIALNEDVAVYFRSRAGRIPSAATITVSNGLTQREFNLSFKDLSPVPEVENLWAMRKLFSLVPHADDYAKDLAAHAQRYLLVSPVTSYIVLENEADYQTFGIAQREENAENDTRRLGLGSRLRKGAVSAQAPAMEGQMSGSEEISADAAPVPVVGAAQSKAKLREVRPAAQSEMEFSSDALSSPAAMSARTQPGPSGIDDAIAASEESKHYTKGYLIFGRLDKIYAEKNTKDMKDAWFFVEIARAYSARGEKQRAQRVLSNLFEISEEDGKALRSMGLVGCFQDDCARAIKAFELAIELRPEEPQNYRDLAWLLAEAGRLEEASALFNRAKALKSHSRFPGMEDLLNRESAWISALAKGDARTVASEDVKTYAWITWNNDNSDVDFHIRESQTQTVWYQNRLGKGQLSNDFTQGYGPEIYTAKSATTASGYYVKYYGADRTVDSQAVVVKFARVEHISGGKVKIHSKVFPLYRPSQFVRVD